MERAHGEDRRSTSRSTKPRLRTWATTSRAISARGGARSDGHGLSVDPYAVQVFRASDGELMMAANNDRLFAALCHALEVPELPRGRPLHDEPDQGREPPTSSSGCSRRVSPRRRSHRLAVLAEAGVPAAPVQDAGQVAEGEQTAALGILQQLERAQVAALPLSADAARVTIACHAAPRSAPIRRRSCRKPATPRRRSPTWPARESLGSRRDGHAARRHAEGPVQLHSDDRRSWRLDEPTLEGWDVFHAIVDRRDGTLYAAANTFPYGGTVQRSATWARRGSARRIGLPEHTGLKLEKTWHVRPGGRSAKSGSARRRVRSCIRVTAGRPSTRSSA